MLIDSTDQNVDTTSVVKGLGIKIVDILLS